jgi:hypothetical protein
MNDTTGDRHYDPADVLRGALAIATYLFGSDEPEARRRVYHLAENRALPFFRLGSIICARKSILSDWVAAQEREVLT